MELCSALTCIKTACKTIESTAGGLVEVPVAFGGSAALENEIGNNAGRFSIASSGVSAVEKSRRPWIQRCAKPAALPPRMSVCRRVRDH